MVTTDQAGNPTPYLTPVPTSTNNWVTQVIADSATTFTTSVDIAQRPASSSDNASSGGLTPAQIGGIVGGILGFLLVLSIFIAVFSSRRRARSYAQSNDSSDIDIKPFPRRRPRPSPLDPSYGHGIDLGLEQRLPLRETRLYSRSTRPVFEFHRPVAQTAEEANPVVIVTDNVVRERIVEAGRVTAGRVLGEVRRKRAFNFDHGLNRDMVNDEPVILEPESSSSSSAGAPQRPPTNQARGQPRMAVVQEVRPVQRGQAQQNVRVPGQAAQQNPARVARVDLARARAGLQ